MDANTPSEENRLTRQVLTELEDAVLNTDRVNDCKVELQDLQSRKEEHIKRERKIREDVRSVFDSYVKDENFDFFKIYNESIMAHLESSLDDYEKKLSQHLDKDMEAKLEEMESYRAKSLRALETFFSRDPIKPLDSELSVRYVEGGYESRYRCSCPKELEYEFLLNSSEVEFLKSRLEGSVLSKGLKLPVRYAKTWVSKEPAIDYEKLDNYYMKQALISDSNLFVTFTDDGTGSEFKFHSSVSEGTTFLEVDYKDSLQTVSLTSQPALNGNINREGVNTLLSQIRTAILYLRDRKLRLSRLMLRDIDVLANLKAQDVFYTVLEILSPRLSEEVSRILTGSSSQDSNDENSINREFIASRLSLLGDRAATVSALLGISGFMDSFSKSQ